MLIPADLQARRIATLAAMARDEIDTHTLPPAAARRLRALLTDIRESASVLAQSAQPQPSILPSRRPPTPSYRTGAQVYEIRTGQQLRSAAEPF